MKKDLKIKLFWEWFLTEKKRIERFYLDEDALNLEQLLNPEVLKIDPQLKWEIGPGLKKEMFLAISPNGSKDRLSLTKEVVAAAPVIRQWEFYWARPPKAWDLKFDLISRDGHIEHINAQKWQYALLRYNDNKGFDLIIVPIGTENISSNDMQRAAHIAVQGQLGEETFLNTIEKIIVEYTADKQYAEELSPLQDVRNHIKFIKGKMSKSL